LVTVFCSMLMLKPASTMLADAIVITANDCHMFSFHGRYSLARS